MQYNEAQERAVNTMNGQVLLVSCPGSGKTTTMLRRIRHMAESGIPENTILMVTFTDAAASEMRGRYLTQYGKCGVVFCTIHSLCLRILTDYAKIPGQIIEADRQSMLIRDILFAKHCQTAPKDALSDISAYKNSGKPMTKFQPSFLDIDVFPEIYRAYGEQKEEGGYIDFDDLLTLCRELLESDPETLRKVREKYRYVMCDEYQDTNNIQKEILYLIAGPDGNICVVGDDDQSIYGFRGANPQVMKDFQYDYPKCLRIDMDTNYRSRPEIIDAAKTLIENNQERFKKDIRAAREAGGSVSYITANDRIEELSKVSAEIKRLVLEKKVPLSQIAVLVRTNVQLMGVAEEFSREKIRYHSGEAVSDIYSHFIFKDIMAYLKLIDGMGTPQDFVRILNRPVRYIREGAFRQLKKINEETVINALPMNGNEYFSQQQDLLFRMFEQFRKAKALSLQDKVLYIADVIGYRKYIGQYCKKMQVDDVLLTSILDFCIRDAGKYYNTELWEKAANQHILATRAAQKKWEKDSVTISTMHRSKGLEWEYVFVIDCCKGIVPFAKAKTRQEIEEERRLFYVAVTRAKEAVYIMDYQKTHAVSGKDISVKPSPFIAEMKETERRLKLEGIREKREQAMDKQLSEFAEGSVSGFRPGMEVHHKTFGRGVVISKNLFMVSVQFQIGTKVFLIKQ